MGGTSGSGRAAGCSSHPHLSAPAPLPQLSSPRAAPRAAREEPGKGSGGRGFAKGEQKGFSPVGDFQTSAFSCRCCPPGKLSRLTPFLSHLSQEFPPFQRLRAGKDLSRPLQGSVPAPSLFFLGPNPFPPLLRGCSPGDEAGEPSALFKGWQEGAMWVSAGGRCCPAHPSTESPQFRNILCFILSGILEFTVQE